MHSRNICGFSIFFREIERKKAFIITTMQQQDEEALGLSNEALGALTDFAVQVQTTRPLITCKQHGVKSCLVSFVRIHAERPREPGCDQRSRGCAQGSTR